MSFRPRREKSRCCVLRAHTTRQHRQRSGFEPLHSVGLPQARLLADEVQQLGGFVGGEDSRPGAKEPPERWPQARLPAPQRYPKTTPRNSALWLSIHAAISPIVRRASRRGCQPRTAVTARWSVMYQRRSAGRPSFAPTTSTVRPVTSRHRTVASQREMLLATPPPTFQWRPA